MAQPQAQTDRDLGSIAEARSLARRAKAAAPALGERSQEQIDAIVDAMAAAVTPTPSRSRGSPTKKPVTASSRTRSRRTCSRPKRSTSSSAR